MRSKSTKSLALYVSIFSLYSCGKESAGNAEGVAVPVFGSDQVIASREVSTIDAIGAKNEIRDLSLLYAPDVSSEVEDEVAPEGDSSCKIFATIKSSTPDEIDVAISATKADCPDLIKGASQLSEYEFQISSQTGIKCVGANFSSLVGRKELTEVSKLDFKDYGCNFKTSKVGTKSRIYVKLKLAAQEGARKTLILSETDSEESNKGEHCFRTSVADKYDVGPCKALSWSKSFWGDVENLNQPYDTDSETSGPRLIRTEVLLSGTSFAPGDLFYQSGSARVSANAWHGKLEYTGSFQQPEIILKSGDEEIAFRLPPQKPSSDASGLRLAQPMRNILNNIKKVTF